MGSVCDTETGTESDTRDCRGTADGAIMPAQHCAMAPITYSRAPVASLPAWPAYGPSPSAQRDQEQRDERHDLVRLLGPAAAQSVRPDPGGPGTAGRLC